MPESVADRRCFRPERSSVTSHILDVALMLLGVGFLVRYHAAPFAVLMGSVNFLCGAWLFLSTHQVVNTWFLVLPGQLVALHPKYQIAARWSEFTDVLERERPNLIRRRPDRVVILVRQSGPRLIANTSVLSLHDEQDLLAEIRSRVRCPVRRVIDGFWPTGR